MYCPKCGMTIPEGTLYCPGCDCYMGGADTSNTPVRKIGFGEAVRNFFTQYAKFSGRATRREFWYVILFTYLAEHAIVLISSAIILIGSLSSTEVTSILSGLFGLATFIPGFAVVWRRLHDIGRSGGWFFILLVPLVGWIILLVFLCKDSDADNRFGPRKV